MVASVDRVKPHEVFDRHRTETGAHVVLATGDPSTTFLVESSERPFQADARLSRRGRSARRVHRLVGLEPIRKCALLQDPVEEQSGQQAQEGGGIGIDGVPETTLAASSRPRTTCSTTWLGDHFPGARGVVQVAADLSAAATRSMTAARLAASTSLTSAMGPPMRERVIDLNEPANVTRLTRGGRPRACRISSGGARPPTGAAAVRRRQVAE
jgi:hypothetical protein